MVNNNSKNNNISPKKASARITTEHRHYATQQIKQAAFLKTMHHTRNNLSSGEKMLSKTFHARLIESLSEIFAHTITRPNPMLAGGIALTFGGFALLILSRNYGFSLPSITFFAIYSLGYILGLLVELIFWLAHQRRS